MDPHRSFSNSAISFFRIFANHMKKQGELTHKEAVKKALDMLGGKAQVKQIYPIAIKLIGKNTRSKDIKATIRRELNSSPYFFKSTPGEEGSWELISYQEEIQKRDKMIADLQAQLAAKDDEQQFIKTEDAFVERLVKAVKHLLKRDKKVVEEIRKLLSFLGRNAEDEELDEWLQGKDKKPSANRKILVKGDYVAGNKNEFEQGASIANLTMPKGMSIQDAMRQLQNKK